MATRQQIAQYCMDQLHMVYPTITKGLHMNWTLLGDGVLAVIVGMACYEVGKNGLTGAYTWVRNLFTSSASAAQSANAKSTVSTTVAA